MTRPQVRAFWVAVATIAILAASQLVLLTTPYEIHPSWIRDRPVNLGIDAIWIVAVAVLMLRQPTSDVWKIVLLWTAAGEFLVIGYLPVEPRVLIDVPLHLLGDVWAAVFIHLIVSYPSGRLAHAFDGRFVAAAYTFAIGINVVLMIIGPEECQPVCDNPIRFLPSAALWDLLQVPTIAAIAIFMAVAITELARHYRAASPGGRRTIAPMLVAAPLFCVTVFAGYYADFFLDQVAQDATHDFNIVGAVEQLSIPVAILITALQTTLARSNVAALAVELGRGVPVGSLQQVLARAMRDPTLELAFQAADGDGLVDPSGRSIPIPGADRTLTRLDRGGDTLAVLIHDPAALAEDPGLVEAVASVARMALENERLAAQVRAQLEEVRASRERIVEAGDAERRRVERDLHDGAQQRLVALAMRLQTASALMPEAADLLDAATIELQTAVAEVRDLSRGLHPTILTELGLAAAIDALAERAPIPISVDIPDRRFPARVEVTAYYVVAEAITNVARYAEAREAHVSAKVNGDHLIATIRDDGRGGADPSRGSGLRGLADRVAAARGQLEVVSPPGAGTTVRVELPLA